jgi:ADP-dependent phosphofructokinase/glucokinase
MEGIAAINQISEVYGPGPAPDIFIVREYQLLAVPTRIASGIIRTVGLGDILSSTAFIADRF